MSPREHARDPGRLPDLHRPVIRAEWSAPTSDPMHAELLLVLEGGMTIRAEGLIRITGPGGTVTLGAEPRP